MGRRIRRSFGTLLALVALAGPASADILDGGFESGLGSWTSAGDVSIVGSGFGVSPTEGSNQVLLSTSAANGAVPAATLENGTLGLGSGYLDALLPLMHPKTKGTTVTEGSAIQQSFTANAGDMIFIDYNFLTNEDVTEQNTSDFLFYELTGVGSDILAHARLQPSAFVSSGTSDYALETGYQTIELTLPSTGTFRLTIGVADVEDTFTDSASVIDWIRLVRAPEPSTALLVGMGLLGLAWSGRRSAAQRGR